MTLTQTGGEGSKTSAQKHLPSSSGSPPGGREGGRNLLGSTGPPPRDADFISLGTFIQPADAFSRSPDPLL